MPIPINLDTVNTLYGLDLTSEELEEWFAARAEPVDEIKTSEDVVVSAVGRELYEKFFRGYTRKQWGLDPSELDKSVTARVPTRTNRDDRYFGDEYQFMPKHGYTRMFETMLNHPNIDVMTQTEYDDIRDIIPHRRLIFTGPIDEYFGFRFGKLPYRSCDSSTSRWISRNSNRSPSSTIPRPRNSPGSPSTSISPARSIPRQH